MELHFQSNMAIQYYLRNFSNWKQRHLLLVSLFYLYEILLIQIDLDIIDKTEMTKIIVDFIGGVKQDITKEGKLNNVEEMVQNISIMITAGKGFLKDLEQFN